MKIRKKCRKCGLVRPFHKHPGKKDGLQSWCVTCNSKQAKKYYKNNKAKYAALRKAIWDRNRLFLLDYLKTHPCVDCGETDPVVLEFDHVRGKKLSNVAQLLTRRSLTAIKIEIAKCEVRCANDHRRRTAKEGGWYRRALQS